VYEGGGDEAVAEGQSERLDGQGGRLAAADLAGSLIVAAPPSRTPPPCATLSGLSLLTELDAFFTDHRLCGELDADVDGVVIWFDCECGAATSGRAPAALAVPPDDPALVVALTVAGGMGSWSSTRPCQRRSSR
jgi:hypothetical protein